MATGRIDDDRDFAAVVVGRHLLVASRRTPTYRALRRRLLALHSTGAHVDVVSALADSEQPGRDGVGRWARRHCIDVVAARDVAAHCAGLGIGAGLILAIGFPADALDQSVDAINFPAAADPGSVLDTVLRRRRQRRVPSIDDDPRWVLHFDDDRVERRRVDEALMALGAHGFGTRGSLEEAPPGSVPMVLAAGAYEGSGSEQHLLPGPEWTRLAVDPPPAGSRRLLDLRTGVLLREETGADAGRLRTLRFASAALPGVAALRAEAEPGRLGAAGASTTLRRPGRSRAAAVGDTGSRIVTATAEEQRTRAGLRTIERVVGLAAGTGEADVAAAAERRLDLGESVGFDRLLADHRAAWARRWGDVDVLIPADPDAQLAIRFALYHLWSHTAHLPELAIGARGLTGTGYAGHVFWDADVFVLPALASIDPPSARAMVNYRLHRLAAARLRAADQGRDGARFPWESAAGGQDVTPPAGMFAGARLPILTGPREEHITADVAWAVNFCAEWCGTPLGAGSAEESIIVEAARYWASRCRAGADGRMHIDAVIGPDEYHEDVNDNAFTNVMARWNLRRGADLLTARSGPDADHREAARWRDVADRLVDGYDAQTGRYEQFAGFYDLRPLTMAEIAPPPVAADVLLGYEQVAASQIIKQADVLMLHHLVPEETAPGSLAPNLDFYLPRTAHGSSLSPAVMAALLARAGRPDDALDLLRIALRLDLDDLTGMTAGGLHMATIGGVWQCLLAGFGGVRVRAGCLQVDPCLPARWPRLDLRFRALGQRVHMVVDEHQVRVDADGPLWVSIAGRPRESVRPGHGLRIIRKEAGDGR